MRPVNPFWRLTRMTGAALLLLVAVPCAASDPLAALIEQFGKTPIVDFVLDRRYGEISIERKGTVKSTYGRPNMDFVTARSLASDAAKLDLEPGAFAEAFLAWQAEQSAVSEARRESDRRISSDEIVRGSSSSPSRPAAGDDVPTTADGLGVPQRSAPIQFRTSSELEAQDPSYGCQRKCERASVSCINEDFDNPAHETACTEKYHACMDRC